MSDTLNKILTGKIVAIVRGVPSDKIVLLAKALVEGGIKCIEVTFDQSSLEKQKDTLKAISILSNEMSEEICVGAGTVMSVDQVNQAAKAGAKYIISPDINEEVIRETKKLGLVSMPGAYTATEIAHGYNVGADIVKVFPAGVAGSKYIKAIKAPLKHIPLVAVGGVNVDNAKEFIDAGCVGIGVGGNLVSLDLINAGKFDEIVKVAKAYTSVLK